MFYGEGRNQVHEAQRASRQGLLPRPPKEERSWWNLEIDPKGDLALVYFGTTAVHGRSVSPHLDHVT